MAEHVAERERRHGAGAAGVLPLRVGRQAELPSRRKLAGAAGALGQLRAELLGLVEVDPVHRNVVALAELRRGQLVREVADEPLPLPLRRFELRGPESSREPDLHLRLVGAALELVRRASHHVASGGTPAEPDAGDRSLLAGGFSAEGSGLLRRRGGGARVTSRRGVADAAQPQRRRAADAVVRRKSRRLGMAALIIDRCRRDAKRCAVRSGEVPSRSQGYFASRRPATSPSRQTPVSVTGTPRNRP